MDILRMNISARAMACLLSAGYKDIDEIKALTDESLMSINNLNRQCLLEIRFF